MTIESKQRNGTLTLGGTFTAVAGQASNVVISPKHNDGGDALELLDGTTLTGDGTTDWTLKGKAVQDWSDPAGFTEYTWDNDGDEVAYEWQPMGVAGPKYSGTVRVKALEVGGDVGKRLEHEFEWPLTGKPNVTRPA
jgi:hypothetical protein